MRRTIKEQNRAELTHTLSNRYDSNIFELLTLHCYNLSPYQNYLSRREYGYCEKELGMKRIMLANNERETETDRDRERERERERAP